MVTSLEEWEKKLVKNEDIETEDLESLLSGISKACELSQDGYVRIKPDIVKKLSDREQIHLVLSARFIVNKLQTRLNREGVISASVSNEELARILRMKQSSVNSRVSE